MQEPRKWLVEDLSAKTPGGELTVGWSAEAGDGLCKLKIGGEEIVTDIDRLAGLLFLLSSEAAQAKRARLAMTEKTAFPVKIELTATEDVRKGEKISFVYNVRVDKLLADHYQKK